MPPTVPNTATITDSQRTIERMPRRSCPTARSRPSSRVRSWIESDSVLAMPITAMTMARASSTYTMPSAMSMPAALASMNSWHVSTSGLP